MQNGNEQRHAVTPTPDPERCLASTAIVDSDHPAILAYARERSTGHDTLRACAVALYYAVRDGIRYDPYGFDLTIHGLRASTTLAGGQGWCVSKAILLAAACRALTSREVV